VLSKREKKDLACVLGRGLPRPGARGQPSSGSSVYVLLTTIPVPQMGADFRIDDVDTGADTTLMRAKITSTAGMRYEQRSNRGSDLNRRPLGYEGIFGRQARRDLPNRTNENDGIRRKLFGPTTLAPVRLPTQNRAQRQPPLLLVLPRGTPTFTREN
jgi:hypothetical protein